MNHPAKAKTDLRACHRDRIAELVPHNWPKSIPDLEKSGSIGHYTELVDAVNNLTQEARLGEHIPEYGPQHLELYRELRDTLYSFGKLDADGHTLSNLSNGHIASKGDAVSSGHTLPSSHTLPNGQTNSNTHALPDGQAFPNSKYPDSKLLTDEIWKRHLEKHTNTPTTETENPFTFADLTTNHIPAIPDGHHDSATTSLALAYDQCVHRAEQAWLSSSNPPSTLDLMSLLGHSISTWCHQYKSKSWHPGLTRRWALYSVMQDPSLLFLLSRLRPRRTCHMKDALLHGMSGSQVVDTVILPCTGMFSDSPSSGGTHYYSGSKVWPASFLVSLVVWADYAGAEDAESSAGPRVWDLLAPWVSALAAVPIGIGVAADEIKACTMTLFGAKLGVFVPEPGYTLTQIWHSRGYDGGVHTSAAAIALTRKVEYPEDRRTLDLAGTVMAIHDSIDCEADVWNRTECNVVLITVYKGHSIQTFIDTVYATLALNWTATDIYGQFVLGALQEQTGGSRWGGPAYLAESRVATGVNFWKNVLGKERVDGVLRANILPTTSELLANRPLAASWHEFALRLSAAELLASPFATDTGEPAKMQDLLALSKGTFVLVCACSCSECGRDPQLKLENWVGGIEDARNAASVMEAVRRVRAIVDGPLQTIRAWLQADPRPDAIYRITAEAFMAVGPAARYVTALVEGLILEDALYHGVDTLSYCVGWLPAGLIDSE